MNTRIEDDGAEILLGVERIGKQRPAGAMGQHIDRGYIVTDHLPVRGSARRNGRAPDAVAGRHVTVRAAVVHWHGHFAAEHDPVMQRDVGNGIKGWRDTRGHKEVLIIQRHGGRVSDIKDQRAEVGSAETVQCSGRRREKITRLCAERAHAGSDKLSLDKEIGVGRVDVQSLNGEHVGADLKERTEGRDVKIFELHGQVVRTPRRGRRVPRNRGRRILAGDLLAVKPGDQAIIISQAQCELGDVRRVHDCKRNPKVGRAVHPAHVDTDVCRDVRAEVHRSRRAFKETRDVVCCQRTIPHCDFVDLAKERIPRGIKYAATADVEAKAGGAVAGNRCGRTGSDLPIEVQLQRLSAAHGGDVVPLVGRKRIGGVYRADRSPELDRCRVNKTKLDCIILTE